MNTKKGIILAGGKGTRLYPITRSIPKSLVPIYDKPTIYYSLTTLLQQKCNDILIICRSEFKPLFEMLLGNGSEFGIKITYAVQDEARGLADAYMVGAAFLNGSSSTMILGDNVFIGDLPILSDTNKGCSILEVSVKDASQYGVFDSTTHTFIEKPQIDVFKFAIPGIYYFNENVSEYASHLHPSKRGEIEITDLMQLYANNNDITVHTLDDNIWFDTGTFEDLADASNYIRFITHKFGIKIGDPHAFSNI